MTRAWNFLVTFCFSFFFFLFHALSCKIHTCNTYMQCHRVGDRYFALTSRYYIAIYILTTRFCLVLLIVNVSQINWLSCQIFGISKQALDFVRDGKMLRPRWKIWGKKGVIFWQHPSWKWFGPRNSAPWKYLKNQIPSIGDWQVMSPQESWFGRLFVGVSKYSEEN